MFLAKITTVRCLALVGQVLGVALIVSATAGNACALFAAPEVDPGSMASALTLLTGGALVLTSRIRSR